MSVEVTDCSEVKQQQKLVLYYNNTFTIVMCVLHSITLEYPFFAISMTIQLEALCDCECEQNKVSHHYLLLQLPWLLLLLGDEQFNVSSPW